MESTTTPILNVTSFLAVLNQTLEYAYPSVEVVGEISGFKINQGKYVFFDLKDDQSSIACFMTVWQLRTPAQDGMTVVVRATAKVTKWGKFSLTIQSIRPKGEGSIKKSFELLRAKLEAEGLFDPARKRLLPRIPRYIGVISSTDAAGYADFIKIINERWGLLKVDVAHVQVQGEVAPDQIIRAIEYFNQQEILPEVVVIIRGGGSADDLSAFNDEKLVRAIAASRIPTLVGVGHEIDETLADMAADVRASTPSNAAQIIVPDRRELAVEVKSSMRQISLRTTVALDQLDTQIVRGLTRALELYADRSEREQERLARTRRILAAHNPDTILAKGYALVKGAIYAGSSVTIITDKQQANAEVIDVKER